MFADEPAEEKLSKVKRIIDFKNLGPETEKAFLKAGINSAKQFIALGWQKTMVKLSKENPKHIHSIFAYALIGALKNQVWNRISEEDKLAARQFTKKLREKTKRIKNKGK